MRTAAALVFIAGVAAIAVSLARRPTVADGRVMEAEILPAFEGQGVVGLVCDRAIPVGRDGAQFGCRATFDRGGTQRLDCALARDGRFSCKPGAAPARAIPLSGDPWGN